MRTLYFFYVFAVVLCLGTQNSAALNSIEPGKQWLDNRKISINAHGGGLLFVNGIYYWYGEHKEPSASGLSRVGFDCYSSTNLTDWKYRGVALSVAPEGASSEIVSGCIMERPKVVYNRQTKKYVMWFHLELKGQGYSSARAGIATSDTPDGTFRYVGSVRSNPGIYPQNMTAQQKNSEIKPTDFSKTWTPEWLDAIKNGMFVRRDLPQGQMSRDMTIFVDDNGKAYHIYASEENFTIQIAELTDDYLSYTGRYVRVLPGGHNEAPTVLKRKGKYYLITSGCTGWAPNAARMAVADSIFGEWKELGNPCTGENADTTFGSQGTFIQKVEGKKDLYIFMADRWNPQRLIDSRYVWLPVLFKNGIPQIKWFDSWKISDFQ